MKIIFVDGYNVISSWPDLRGIKEYSLESSRQKLIEVMMNYSTYNGFKVFVVFDAHMVSGSIENKEKINNNLIVVFTKYGETADIYIEKSINTLGHKVDVCVVTSDFLEQQTSFQRGATRMSSLEFYHEVKKVEVKIHSKTEKKYSEKRLILEDRIQSEVLEELEKIRRGS